MFLDEVKIFVAGGSGGNGCNAMRKEKFIPMGGPSGGNGGKGGDVVLKAVVGASTLAAFYRRRHYKAGRGGHGGGKDRYGKFGKGLVVETPVGTLVKDGETKQLLADLDEPGDSFVLARGGQGGLGNAALSREHQMARFALKGEAGQERWVVLELKLLADVGLVGFPNAGKSTLLSRVSAAKPKIAGYPFTTLAPQLGVVTSGFDSSFVLADIPGLVDGAHEGKGMGDRFLRHVERTRLLVHLVDVSGWEGRSPVKDYEAIRNELQSWHPLLASRPTLVVATKMDVEGSEETARTLEEAVGQPIHRISAVTGLGLGELIQKVASMLPDLPLPRLPEGQPVQVHGSEARPMKVERSTDGSFLATGTQLERIVGRTFLDNEYAVDALQLKLNQLGLEERLQEAGVQDGDLVRIGEFEFTYFQDS